MKKLNVDSFVVEDVLKAGKVGKEVEGSTSLETKDEGKKDKKGKDKDKSKKDKSKKDKKGKKKDKSKKDDEKKSKKDKKGKDGKKDKSKKDKDKSKKGKKDKKKKKNIASTEEEAFDLAIKINSKDDGNLSEEELAQFIKDADNINLSTIEFDIPSIRK